jgi:hypothetical protein
MIVLSWFVLIVSAFFFLINVLGVLIKDTAKQRLWSAVDIVIFGITFTTAFWDIFG